MENQGPSTCENCGGDIQIESCKLEEIEGEKLYMMEDVPGLVCQECGEMWIPEPFIKEFEKMMVSAKKRHSRKKRNQ